MATKKPKTTATKSTAKSTAKKAVSKPKTTVKTAAKTVAKPVSEAPEITNKVEETKKSESIFKGFFSKKYEEKESILTIFKKPKLYGALLGEMIGSLLVTMFLFCLISINVANMAMFVPIYVGIVVAVFAFSGAQINPIITAGMMATRRVSVIRGVLYIIAQIVGAWLGWMILNAFHIAGGDTAYPVPAMSAIVEDGFWNIAMIEALGAVIISFFFARALAYKRSVFTFAFIIAGGLAFAALLGYIICNADFGLQGTGNFIFNPATALMLQIFPTTGENFGEVIGGVLQALSAFAIIPMIAGVVGFYISDFTSRLSGGDNA